MNQSILDLTEKLDNAIISTASVAELEGLTNSEKR